MPRPRKPASPFRYFNSSPEVIRMAVMLYVRYPLSLRNVEDLLFKYGIDICHEGTVKLTDCGRAKARTRSLAQQQRTQHSIPQRRGLGIFALSFWRRGDARC